MLFRSNMPISSSLMTDYCSENFISITHRVDKCCTERLTYYYIFSEYLGKQRRYSHSGLAEINPKLLQLQGKLGVYRIGETIRKCFKGGNGLVSQTVLQDTF